MVRLVRWLILIAAALILSRSPATAGEPPEWTTATALVASQGENSRLLDVPYLSQTADLCGGAAMAMVLRYWGERQVYPEDFAPLVDRSASGIPTDALARDVTRRGWQTFPLDGRTASSREWMRAQVDRGRPLVALIEVGPHRYHYVVIVAWTADQVIVHDPARAPYRVMSGVEFERAWAPARYWALLVLPSNDAAIEPAPSFPESFPSGFAVESTSCGALVREMVTLGRTGAIEAAETGLLAATQLCPLDASAWRELAGVQFLQSRWSEASVLARHAAELDPSDRPGWDLLATSRFLDDEPDLALDAWNRIGRPTVDVVRVQGAPRSRDPVIVALLDLPSRSVLTAEARRRASRRLAALPSAVLTSVHYRPTAGGLVEIDATAMERPTVARGMMAAVATAARAGLQRALTVHVAAPTGSGELWTGAWRWWEARPRVSVALAVPAFAWLPGVTTFEGSWERPSYVAPEGVRQVSHRRVALTVTEWATSRVRWNGGVALDRWAEDSYVAVDTGVDLRLARDHLSVGVDAGVWMPVRSGHQFVRGGVSSAWRSTREPRRRSWQALVGLAATSAGAPFDLWPGAGTGHARTPLLRAHPLLEAGVVSGPVFGRQLVHGTVEYQQPLRTGLGGAVRLAGFVDTARAWRRHEVNKGRSWHTDVGLGLRLALPYDTGTARVDVARGLRDRRVAVSIGWHAAWPGE